ncbi:hypothetical protein EJ02DRAFT_427803 [Clathrospora elynae]|uniref:Uncharacterized protein n=1 Tax=Clathrospora elynae TaxID=706981 RepID=A0A6A5S7U2_9PLEO|nr:hypothetical protein EJ02DRAFT_427803 [Clathrospora elynae]
MRVSVLAVASAALAVLTVATPAPVVGYVIETSSDGLTMQLVVAPAAHETKFDHDSHDIITSPDYTLHAHSGSIIPGLGRQHINVGGGDTHTPYSNVIDAIGSLCDPYNEGCLQGTLQIDVFVYAPTAPGWWCKDSKIYDIMRSAVAASFERGKFSLENRHTCSG